MTGNDAWLGDFDMKRSERLEKTDQTERAFKFPGEAPVPHLGPKDSFASFDKDIQEVRAMLCAFMQRILCQQFAAVMGGLFVE